MIIKCADFTAYEHQIAGLRHQENLQSSEDAVLIRRSSGLLFAGIADGQSGKKCSLKGAAAALEFLYQYVSSNGVKNLQERRFLDECRYEMIRGIRQALSLQAIAYQQPLEEFASTFLCAAIDIESGLCILIHLGDGGAVGIRRSGEIIVLSPSNEGRSLPGHQTYLSTSPDALSHISIAFIHAEDYRRIALVSDGASCIMNGNSIPESAKGVLRHGCPGKIFEMLDRFEAEDDASCVILDRESMYL